MASPRINFLDRLILLVAPRWGLQRVRARVLARHFEAASVGRRTAGWNRKGGDANAAASGASLAYLRNQARDLVRNNPWARRGLQRLVTNVVGWGIQPKATGRGGETISKLWKQWAETTQCDAAGRLTFYGLQRLVMRTVVESGEVLIRRRFRRIEDGLAIPLQLQVLEPDYIDTGKDGVMGTAGGPIVQGIEFDAIGRRVAYWLFDTHPGAMGPLLSPVSRRISADGILHVYNQERAGQARGYSWFASIDVRLHEHDEFEDATLMKQKIAACFAAFVTDVDGSNSALGAGTDSQTGLPLTDPMTNEPLDSLGPGMILNLPAGKSVTVANPPASTDHAAFVTSSLRGVAAGLGVTYEDLTGDMTQINFSSGRMGRIAHMADVEDWRWNMLIPQFCAPAWDWMLTALQLAGENVEMAPATWTPPALPMIDPDAEGRALSQMVRTGAMTIDAMVRAQGYDPEEHFAEYEKGIKRLDKLGIILDCDPRKTSSAGQLQAAPAPAAVEEDDDEVDIEIDDDETEPAGANGNGAAH